ncbi:MAG: glucose-6-phosphate isomerase [Myxococcales bacterium]|nr:MAG: glucose-6-phosphate isomerase [Myxococcales bacterium]
MTSQHILSLDYSFAVGSGSKAIDDAQLIKHESSFQNALTNTLRRVQSGELGFWNLPDDESLLASISELKKALPKEIRHLLVLGIGGSSLGGKSLCHALSGSLEIPADAKQNTPRVYFVDNSDPWYLQQLLERIEASKTLVVPISKSGGTVETMSQLLIVEQWLASTLGKQTAKKHLVLITDPKDGKLREKAQEEGIQTLAVPSNVGGRFSVLSAVGLFPAAMSGINIAEVQAGAREMKKACAATSLKENPAGLLAILNYLHHQMHGRHVHVLMPYADALRPYAGWFVQLWAESLGKRLDLSGKEVHVGPTQLPAIGATDQHAQLQLFSEGPDDKFYSFIEVLNAQKDLKIPESSGDLAYLAKHSLQAVLRAECLATRTALHRQGRPSLCIKLSAVNERSLGALFFLHEAATALAGELYRINAFDQPGVEASKQLTSGLLGRPGYEAYGKGLSLDAHSPSQTHLLECPLVRN